MIVRDDLGNLCQYLVNIQMYSIAMPGAPEMTALRNAQRVYGQYGICIRLNNGQSLLLSRQQQSSLQVIDGSCEWSTLSDDQQQLHDLRDDYRSRPFDIHVYFVQEIRKTDGSRLNGCGGHLPGRPAVTIAASGTPWTLAHELGHVLLGPAFRPVHSNDRANLMFGVGRTDSTTPILTADQLRAIKASRYCLIPEEYIPPFFSPGSRRQ